MDFLYLDFVNSSEKDYLTGEPQEHLKEVGWLENLLTRYDLIMPTALTPTAMKSLTAFRTILRRVTEALIEGEEFADEDTAKLNQYLAKVTLRRRLDNTKGAPHLKLVPQQQNWDWVQAEIVTSLVDFIAQRDRERLKICDNHNCCWIFYDESKSRTRRYCSDHTCGNLIKVRRFRERHKADAKE